MRADERNAAAVGRVQAYQLEPYQTDSQAGDFAGARDPVAFGDLLQSAEKAAAGTTCVLTAMTKRKVGGFHARFQGHLMQRAESDVRWPTSVLLNNFDHVSVNP